MDILAWNMKALQKHFFPKLKLAYLFTFEKKKELSYLQYPLKWNEEVQ